jgi:hypothetical protein
LAMDRQSAQIVLIHRTSVSTTPTRRRGV